MMRETVTDMRKHVWRLAPDVVPDGDDEIDMRLRESRYQFWPNWTEYPNGLASLTQTLMS
jgi:hypothetical protein